MPLPFLAPTTATAGQAFSSQNQNSLLSRDRTQNLMDKNQSHNHDLNIKSYAIDYEGEEVNDMIDIRAAFHEADGLTNIYSTSKEGFPIYSVPRYPGNNIFLDRSFTELWHDYETNETKLEKKSTEEREDTKSVSISKQEEYTATAISRHMNVNKFYR